MKKTETRKGTLARLTLATFAITTFAWTSSSQAALVTVGSDLTWTLSTTVVPDVDGPATWTTNVMTAPPTAGTFTSSVALDTGGQIPPVAAALGVTPVDSGSDITYYRQTFNLDPFGSVSATVDLGVDNGAAVWINGSFVGAETSFVVGNWQAPFPSFDIDTDGSIININKFDTTSPFTGFLAGTNEVILAVRNTPAPDGGGFAFRMDVTTVPIPEPNTVVLMLLASVGLVFVGWRRRRR